MVARASRHFSSAGTYRVRLRPKRDVRRKLKRIRGKSRVTLTAQLKTDAGMVDIASRKLRLHRR
jgi:hypothetical protein